MLKALIVILPVVLAIYCLVDLGQSRAGTVRALPRSAWAVLIVLAPLAGPLAWLVWGRPQRGRPGPPRPQRRVVAPDDDPDFLRR
ncbi:MAG: PLDc N-terminal domain-containing protein, partial [Actinomycetota bacterium]|nr:PLDc N-terminal domain-containing protein [Actinomycetota bacterium]